MFLMIFPLFFDQALTSCVLFRCMKPIDPSFRSQNLKCGSDREAVFEILSWLLTRTRNSSSKTAVFPDHDPPNR